MAPGTTRGPVKPQPQQVSGLVRFLRSIRFGIVAFVVAGPFLFSGVVKTYATFAIFAGVGWAVLALIGRALTKVRWDQVGGAVALGVLASEAWDVAHHALHRRR